MEWGGGRASRVRILSREKEGISEGELRGETKKEELREEERWLGVFFSLADLAGEYHLQVWLLWFSCVLSFFIFVISHSW